MNIGEFNDLTCINALISFPGMRLFMYTSYIFMPVAASDSMLI